MVDTIGAAVEFVAVKDGTGPFPLAARPIAVLLFVQLKLVPPTGPAKLITVVFTPAQ